MVISTRDSAQDIEQEIYNGWEEVLIICAEIDVLVCKSTCSGVVSKKFMVLAFTLNM